MQRALLYIFGKSSLQECVKYNVLLVPIVPQCYDGDSVMITKQRHRVKCLSNSTNNPSK